MRLAAKEHYYTFEEYLALEEKAESKSEYHQGEIVSMAGASFEHNLIAGNIFNGLSNRLNDKPCYVIQSDLRLWIAQSERCTYPDIMVICGEPVFFKNRRDIITNPQIIIEVLSASTEKLDRGDKFRAYWQLDSLKEYALVDQYQMRVEYFRRVDEKIWELRIYTKADERLTLPALEVELPLSEIYRSVTFENE